MNTGSLLDASRWTVGANGTVPPLATENTFEYNAARVYDTDLDAPPHALLANQNASVEDKVSPLNIGDASEGSYTAGSRVPGWNSDGSLHEFDVASIASGVSRKDGITAVGPVSGAVALDFDTGSYDQKSIELSADVTDLALSATRDTTYELHVKASGSARLQVSTSVAKFSPYTTEFIIDPDIDEWTVLKFSYNSTEDVFHWG